MHSEGAPSSARRLLALGASLLGCSVIIGAFGAHGLKDIILEHRETFHTGVFYQFIHSIGVMLVGLLLLLETIELKAAKRIALLFTVGILLFSGSLYALSITKLKLLGAITPFGGIAFIVGWFLLAIKLHLKKSNTTDSGRV